MVSPSGEGEIKGREGHLLSPLVGRGDRGRKKWFTHKGEESRWVKENWAGGCKTKNLLNSFLENVNKKVDVGSGEGYHYPSPER